MRVGLFPDVHKGDGADKEMVETESIAALIVIEEMRRLWGGKYHYLVCKIGNNGLFPFNDRESLAVESSARFFLRPTIFG